MSFDVVTNRSASLSHTVFVRMRVHVHAWNEKKSVTLGQLMHESTVLIGALGVKMETDEMVMWGVRGGGVGEFTIRMIYILFFIQSAERAIDCL